MQNVLILPWLRVARLIIFSIVHLLLLPQLNAIKALQERCSCVPTLQGIT